MKIITMIQRLLNFSDTATTGAFTAINAQKDILREAVTALEKQNRAKIIPLAKKEKAPN